MRISTTFKVSSVVLGAEKVGNPKRKSENCIRAGKKPKILYQEIEPNPLKDRAMHEGDNPSF
jgi:hypothetical protein